MAAWNSTQYLKFEKERNQPCVDLVQRISVAAPASIVDLGCGPGNSTQILRARWPAAQVTGVDSSEEMLATARRSHPSAEWSRADIREWVPTGSTAVVFSNAALQWLPDHRTLVPRLWSHVAPGGALAFQVPARTSPRAAWVEAFHAARATLGPSDGPEENVNESHVLRLEEYYDLLASAGAQRVDLWDTEYDHVLAGPDSVVEWTRGTALRPFLAGLAGEPERERFLSAYRREIERQYPTRTGGSVVFPFLRRFVVAYR